MTVIFLRISMALCLYPEKLETARPLRFLIFSDLRISRSGNEVVSYIVLLFGFAKMGKYKRSA